MLNEFSSLLFKLIKPSLQCHGQLNPSCIHRDVCAAPTATDNAEQSIAERKQGIVDRIVILK